ncbi:MAG: hypothetical protein LM590_15750 [Thermofilum sp.]|jgi:hypothetical protein|nr:hypothetical protein [Thermofilum sp.]
MYLGVKIPKSTLHYWEVRHSDVVEEVLKALFRLLSPGLRLLSDRLGEACGLIEGIA